MAYAKAKFLLSNRKINMKMQMEETCSFMHPFERQVSSLLKEPRYFHRCCTRLCVPTKFLVPLKWFSSAYGQAELWHCGCLKCRQCCPALALQRLFLPSAAGCGRKNISP